MNMQDNELDDLFRSKLGNMEMEPDARVWKDIAARVTPETQKRWVPMMRIAATIVVVLTAGMWLFNQHKQPKKVTRYTVARQKAPAVVVDGATSPATGGVAGASSPVIVQSANNNKGQRGSRMAAVLRVLPHKKTVLVPQGIAAPPVHDALPAQPADGILQVAQNKSVDKPVLPDITLAASTIINEKPVLKTNMVPATLVTAHATENKSRKHGIHTLGDLINVVVAKVDKREDKLIEFTDVDDDEATVTGINLGIIKIKQDK